MTRSRLQPLRGAAGDAAVLVAAAISVALGLAPPASIEVSPIRIRLGPLARGERAEIRLRVENRERGTRSLSVRGSCDCILAPATPLRLPGSASVALTIPVEAEKEPGPVVAYVQFFDDRGALAASVEVGFEIVAPILLRGVAYPSEREAVATLTAAPGFAAEELWAIGAHDGVSVDLAAAPDGRLRLRVNFPPGGIRATSVRLSRGETLLATVPISLPEAP